MAGILMCLMLMGVVVSGMPAFSQAQAVNHAAVVVQAATGQVQTACVAFTEPEITGYDLLLRSDMDTTVAVDGNGTAVCAIGETGCPANDCFCQCTGADCVYWSYWHQLAGEWQYAKGGAGQYAITDGMVDGWVWGSGSVTTADSPPLLSFAEVCTESNLTSVVPQLPNEAEPNGEAGNLGGYVVLVGVLLVFGTGIWVKRNG
jgi:hypothetical protein